MRTVLAVLLLAATLVVAPGPLAVAPASAADDVRLDGVTVHLRPGTRQVVTVNHTRGHHARVTYWVRKGGDWVQRLRARDGRIGYGGLVVADRRRQGTGTTPLGTFRLPWVFGTHRRQDSWDLDYRRIRRGDYWVQDNASRYYNRYRNRSQGGFRWRLPASDENSSERLRDYPVQYEWSIVTSFNARQVRHRGAGIFLHVNGDGATAGCVSAPRPFIRALVRRLDPDRNPVVAIGR
ncbi:L,D-transpeptidase family protein [Nocardioides sp. MAHUQ-72]|uniref:L,D-transpeptidase family protein n=1 Tax=unclassified Nocardioides TaxID=2615069 RepID=UPI003620AB09